MIKKSETKGERNRALVERVLEAMAVPPEKLSQAKKKLASAADSMKDHPLGSWQARLQSAKGNKSLQRFYKGVMQLAKAIDELEAGGDLVYIQVSKYLNISEIKKARDVAFLFEEITFTKVGPQSRSEWKKRAAARAAFDVMAAMKLQITTGRNSCYCRAAAVLYEEFGIGVCSVTSMQHHCRDVVREHRRHAERNVKLTKSSVAPL